MEKKVFQGEMWNWNHPTQYWDKVGFIKETHFILFVQVLQPLHHVPLLQSELFHQLSKQQDGGWNNINSAQVFHLPEWNGVFVTESKSDPEKTFAFFLFYNSSCSCLTLKLAGYLTNSN